MPIEIEDHTVPHFKAPVNFKLGLLGPERPSFLCSKKSIENLGHLVHKKGFVKAEVPTTVCVFPSVHDHGNT